MEEWDIIWEYLWISSFSALLFGGGLHGNLAQDCPHNSKISRGVKTSTNVNQDRFAQRGSQNRGRGKQRAQFSDVNVVYNDMGMRTQWKMTIAFMTQLKSGLPSVSTK